jgi:dTDP-4-amino-4,6-dideoxygalactose transaminase
MDGLMAVARRHDLVVIEDCSHAHGAVYHDEKIGTIGDIGIFSLQQKKNLCTGDGGMVTTDNAGYAEAIRRLRTFGHEELSYNYRMTEIAAAIGQVRLPLLDGHNAARRANAGYVEEKLRDVPGITVRKPIPDTVGVYYSLLLECDPEVLAVSRREFIAAVRAEGIPVARSYRPVHRMPNFHPSTTPARGCPWQWTLYDAPESERPCYEDGVCPVAEDYADNRLMELKVHPPAGKEDMEQAVQAIRKVIENVSDLKS